MIEGCRRARNVDALHHTWDKLVASGLSLDKFTWTARITALIDCGEPDAGLRALSEMAQRWKARHLPENRTLAVEPTIEPVNAALAGLIRLQKLSTARGVLAWAGKQGIQPDILTFNTLLRPLVRGGMTEDINGVFEAMRQLGIEADVATYTILLEGTLARLVDQPPEELTAVVKRILNDMESSGIPANMQTFGKMVYILTQEGERADRPLMVLLDYIHLKRLKMSTHIYTMLAEYYFSRGAEGAKRVADLIKLRNQHEDCEIDRVFWERVIMGYCQAGETSMAWEEYRKLDASGAIVIYSTLYELLLALLRAGETDAAAELIYFKIDVFDMEGSR
ncbi:hypothetical protein P8C59_006177 [Phyllachora maydis]|uniref:Pentatricopeptide repeat-containing protein n=2 Tax=Phyllachora maydis TaxID=1825666 RepID=A0AAD9I763_9PEZI|nr:hypothetical protein P8C59_006177 [Phyllachora maydis]